MSQPSGTLRIIWRPSRHPLILFIAVFFCWTSTAAEAAGISFETVREHVLEAQWKKARSALQAEMLDLVKNREGMDGADLMRAIRYRAIIEAGAGDFEAAKWWWHAGLNLQTEGASPWLELLPDSAAQELASVEVRPMAPKVELEGGLPKTRKGDRPSKTTSLVYRRAYTAYSGVVSFQVRMGVEGRFLEPLIESSTASSSVCVYAALAKMDGVRFPMSWRRGRPETFTVEVKFRGRR